MSSTDWAENALRSEIEFSKALQSHSIAYPNFIHLYNPFVPWGGDFNRTVGLKVADFQSFDQALLEVERIHREKGLDAPDRFDLYPPALDPDSWTEHLESKGYRLQTAIFFNNPAQDANLPGGFNLYQPDEAEYLEWYTGLSQAQGYADADWFQQILPLKQHFSRVFLPYWLMRSEEQIGWVYAAHLGDISRLFEVEIKPAYQGQGFGRLLMQAITAESYRQGMQHVLLQASERLRPFYEKCGFCECSRNSIIRRIEP
jgi:GNAT superfamily N-acetyltransferase